MPYKNYHIDRHRYADLLVTEKLVHIGGATLDIITDGASDSRPKSECINQVNNLIWLDASILKLPTQRLIIAVDLALCRTHAIASVC